MTLDTSAIVAILLAEPEADRMQTAIDAALFRRLSAASLVEASMVMQARRGDIGEEGLDLLLRDIDVEVVSVSTEHANLARTAFRTYGKGRHPAGLTYGDSFSYALSKAFQEPLLFKGDDFSQTDVLVAEY